MGVLVQDPNTGKVYDVSRRRLGRFVRAGFTVVDDDVLTGDGYAGTMSDDPVPDGSVADIVVWAGDDPVRRQAAVNAELDRANPRKGVLALAE